MEILVVHKYPTSHQPLDAPRCDDSYLAYKFALPPFDGILGSVLSRFRLFCRHLQTQERHHFYSQSGSSGKPMYEFLKAMFH